MLDAFGGVDVLVNNAGVAFGGTLLDAPDDEILRTMNTNAFGQLWCTRAFLPHMLERWAGSGRREGECTHVRRAGEAGMW